MPRNRNRPGSDPADLPPTADGIAPGSGGIGSLMASLALAVAASVPIALSFAISPSPEGLGTHRKLGLGPCAVFATCHAPCPFCGMTTSFCLMARGRIAEAFVANPSGPLLYVLCLLTSPFFMWWAITKRSLAALFWDWPLERPAAWLLVAVLAGWAAKLCMI